MTGFYIMAILLVNEFKMSWKNACFLKVISWSPGQLEVRQISVKKLEEELYQPCIIKFHIFFIFKTDSGDEDMKKGTQLLEIYALEIQMYTAQVVKYWSTKSYVFVFQVFWSRLLPLLFFYFMVLRENQHCSLGLFIGTIAFLSKT